MYLKPKVNIIQRSNFIRYNRNTPLQNIQHGCSTFRSFKPIKLETLNRALIMFYELFYKEILLTGENSQYNVFVDPIHIQLFS